MQKWLIAAGLVGLMAGAPAMAEPSPATPLTLERVFASPALNGPTPRMVRLSPDGKWVTSLRPRAEDRERFDLWAMPASGGAWRMLVDSTKLGTAGTLTEAEKMQRERARIAGTKGIVAYSWSADSQTILVPVDGELFLAVLDGAVTRLTQSGGALDASVNPKGGFVSFVRDQNVVILNRATGQEQALTTDGKDAISWGLAEFVAQEEMDRTRGLWWSPDDARIAVQRTDESAVQIVSRAAIGADGTRVYDQRYPAAGTANAQVELWVMDPAGASRVKVDLGADPDIYLARVDWAADGKSLYVQRQSRDQKRLDLLQIDPVTGKSKILFSETSKSWINLHDSFRALKDGSLIWQSERDGFAHLYRFQKGRWTQLTRGDWMVRGLVGMDETKGLLYFLANRDTPLEQHLYAVPMAGGAIRRLTKPGAWHNAVMAKAGNRAIIDASSQSQPTQVWLADSQGKRLAWIEEATTMSPLSLAQSIQNGSAHVQLDWGVTQIVADALTKLQSSQIMELEALELEHRVDIFLNVAQGQTEPVFRPLNKLSTGQQCTAILHMLLLENIDPLLMDQPEDNLDNAFIADRIVTELREAKTSRQFLFATHNANIPVFGDAEWIGVFTAAESQGSLGLDAQGSIDVPVIRDQVASILEGGRDAFIQRKEKYEF